MNCRYQLTGLCTAKIFLITYIVLAACNKDEKSYIVNKPPTPNLKDIITFTKVTKDTVEADSASFVILEVKIDSITATNYRNITFRSYGGVFDNNDTIKIVPANYSGFASIPLVSKKPGIVKVTASVSTFSVDTMITFIPSLPDEYYLNVDKRVADTSAIFIITAELFRNPRRGLITNPLKVTFEVTSDTLVYRPFSFSADNIVTLEVRNPFKVTGTFKIKSFVPMSDGSIKPDSLNIRITK